MWLIHEKLDCIAAWVRDLATELKPTGRMAGSGRMSDATVTAVTAELDDIRTAVANIKTEVHAALTAEGMD